MDSMTGKKQIPAKKPSAVMMAKVYIWSGGRGGRLASGVCNIFSIWIFRQVRKRALSLL